MRIGYLVSGPAGPGIGVFRKIQAQTALWSRGGAVVGVFARTDRDSAVHWKSINGTTAIAAGSDPWHRYRAREQIISRLLDWRPDVIYVRQMAYSPRLARIMERYPTIIEVNSDDVAEAVGASFGKRAFLRITRERLLSRAAGLVFVSGELARSARFQVVRTPRIVVPNSIVLAANEVVPAVVHDGTRLLFVGDAGGAVWHGLDRIAGIGRLFPDWQIDIVGTHGAALEGAPANVVFHGPLEPGQYRHLIAAADAAIGTMALFRNGMEEASPLKVREYLAAGLPVICAYRDSHFPLGAPFILTLPNDARDLAPHRTRIERFVQDWRGRRVSRDDVAAIDAERNEDVRLGFIAEVAKTGRLSRRFRSSA